MPKAAKARKSKITGPTIEPHKRELWLGKLAKLMAPIMEHKAGEGMLEPHAYRVSCAWPSKSGTSRSKRRIGECWTEAASADLHREIFISPTLADPLQVAATLAHEMIHAFLPWSVGHKKPFPQICKAIGLAGKPSATCSGPEFEAWIKPLLAKCGPYPHAKLDPSLSGHKKQGTRLLKCECQSCGYVCRVTAKWLDVAGAPICPTDQEPMECVA